MGASHFLFIVQQSGHRCAGASFIVSIKGVGQIPGTQVLNRLFPVACCSILRPTVAQTGLCSLRLFGREMIFSREPSGSTWIWPTRHSRKCALRAWRAHLFAGAIRLGTAITAILLCAIGGGISGWSQSGVPAGHAAVLSAPTDARPAKLTPENEDDAIGPGVLGPWLGMPVRRILFEGVDASRLDPLPGHLAQAEGAPLTAENLQKSLRELFATGLFETVEVEASALEDGVALDFKGTARAFIGTVSVDGAKGATINTQLDRASQLSAGTRFTPAKLSQAIAQMRQTLEDNGFHEPQIEHTLTPHPQDQLVDVAFHVTSGPQARVGTVQVTGEPGMSAEEFRHYAHLRTGAHVDHDTVNRALAGVLKHYRKQERLEAEIKLESGTYDTTAKRTNFSFSASQGPEVKVRVQGVSMSRERIRHVIPIYEEGTVDEDLLNEGNRRVRDYYQRLGYFDVKVDHQQPSAGSGPPAEPGPEPSSDQVEILYNVKLGPRRHVERVSVDGNHYFNSAVLEQLLNVHAAGTFDRHGTYSQALVSADVSALEAVYRNNGFSKVKIKPETSTPETSAVDNSAPAPIGPTYAGEKTSSLSVVYHIDEGQQQRVGSVRIEGADQVNEAKLTPLLNTTPGQLLSPRNLAGDRDALVTNYLSRGFERPQVDVSPAADPADPDKVDVVFHVTEGQQVFVRNVLFTGLHYTRPQTVAAPSPSMPATRLTRLR
jgi:outer membrane protein insertion porin family